MAVGSLQEHVNTSCVMAGVVFLDINCFPLTNKLDVAFFVQYI